MNFGHDPSRVAEYVLWLAHESGDSLDPMKIQKLIYIAHGWSLGLLGMPLINEPAEAWPYGPVIPSLYRRYKKYGADDINEVPTTEPEGFSEQERQLMRQVWQQYRAFTPLQLSAMTHQIGTPWALTRKVFGPGAAIPDSVIREHYKQLAKQRVAKPA